jgi:hypothetical protein
MSGLAAVASAFCSDSAGHQHLYFSRPLPWTMPLCLRVVVLMVFFAWQFSGANFMVNLQDFACGE